MKQIIIVFLLFVFGCGEETNTKKESISSANRIDVKWVDVNGHHNSEEFTVIVVDSCEYIIAGYDRSRMISHKGNCKYCEQRKCK